MNKSLNKTLIISLVFLLVAILILFNFRNLKDLFLSNSFQPSSRLLSVEKSLNLTKKGKTIFRASVPTLDSRDSFNQNCRTSQSDSSILGCFVSEQIHVFDIDSPEFPGIVESTSAHELLHAVWLRLSESEKKNLTPVLKSVRETAGEDFEKSLSAYPESEQLEETYVRSATQVKNLPASLEAHFAEFFEDQDAIVDFYNSYILPFSELEKTLATISENLNSLKMKIDAETTEYSSRSEKLAQEVSEFNSCAEKVGCFSENTFRTQRNELLAKNSALDELYSALDSDISAYNRQVEEYNQKILYGKSLQNIINSNPKPKESL